MTNSSLNKFVLIIAGGPPYAPIPIEQFFFDTLSDLHTKWIEQTALYPFAVLDWRIEESPSADIPAV